MLVRAIASDAGWALQRVRGPRASLPVVRGSVLSLPAPTYLPWVTQWCAAVSSFTNR